VHQRTRAAPAAAKVEDTKLGGDHAAMLTLKARQFSNLSRAARALHFAARLAPTIKELQEGGVITLRAIAAALDERGIPPPRGQGLWHATQVRVVLARLATYSAADGKLNDLPRPRLPRTFPVVSSEAPPPANQSQKRPLRKLTFTELALERLKPDAGRVNWWDTEIRGLSVLVSADTKTFRVMFALNGKIYTEKLGRVGEMALKEARRCAASYRALAADGIDPRKPKKAALAYGEVVNQ